MILIVSDIDGTLLPNGKYEGDNSLETLFKKIKNLEHRLVYATGRSLEHTQAAIDEFALEKPDYLVAEVGTRIYRKEKEGLVEEYAWQEYLEEKTKNWNRKTIEEAFAQEGVSLQEDWNQNGFKVSFYFNSSEKPGNVFKKAKKTLEEKDLEASVIWSTDPLETVGLIDVLPKYANKGRAIEFLRKRLVLEKEKVYYSGDSGNDLSALTQGYNSILVKNAHPSIKEEFERLNKRLGFKNCYTAKGTNKLSGNYASGIIEGLIHFGVLDKF